MSNVNTTQDFLLDYLKRMGDASALYKQRWRQLYMMTELLLTLPPAAQMAELVQRCAELTDMLAAADLAHDIQTGLMAEPSNAEEAARAYAARRKRHGIPEPREVVNYPCKCGKVHANPWEHKPVTDAGAFEAVPDERSRYTVH